MIPYDLGKAIREILESLESIKKYRDVKLQRAEKMKHHIRLARKILRSGD